MAKTKTPANIVGPQIRKRRSELDLTQETGHPLYRSNR
jgi:hypothetical protein